MCFYPTALLSGLLLAFLVSDLQGSKAIDQQALQAFNQSAAIVQRTDSNMQPFHRGSGRFQQLREATASHA
ncbi:MAG: hypothetical protein RBJ76_27965 [Stenomitos frigidus ULC029]